MESDIQQQLKEQGEKIEAIYVSVEKTRKYFQIMMWISIAVVVLPLILMLFIVPVLLSSYTSTLEGLI